MPTQVVNAPVPVATVSLTPLARVVRTVIQVALSVGASIPIILNTTGLTGTQVTKVETIIATAVAVISTVQNLLESYGVIPVVGGKVASATTVTTTTSPLMVPEAATTPR